MYMPRLSEKLAVRESSALHSNSRTMTVLLFRKILLLISGRVAIHVCHNPPPRLLLGVVAFLCQYLPCDPEVQSRNTGYSAAGESTLSHGDTMFAPPLLGRRAAILRPCCAPFGWWDRLSIPHRRPSADLAILTTSHKYGAAVCGPQHGPHLLHAGQQVSPSSPATEAIEQSSNESCQTHLCMAAPQEHAAG